MRLTHHQISALANCCQVAGEKFRENAKLLEAWPSIAEQFVQQADEAFELSELLSRTYEANIEVEDE